MLPNTMLRASRGTLRRWMNLSDPYKKLARMASPTGTYLLYVPCTWSILMAAQQTPDVLASPLETAHMLALFGVGAWIMRGAGCTINDLWDQRIDRQVERTRVRPLASGTLSRNQAYGFLLAQLSAGLLVLLQLNWTSILLGASSLSLVVIYPFMKRITYYPQLVLGLTFNWGALLGFTALTHTLPLCAFPLYLGGVGWTLLYDTIYAHQDLRDDVRVGVKSTAIRFGARTRPVLTAVSLASASCFAAAGALAQLPAPYWAGLAGTLAHLLWLARTTRFTCPAACARAFRQSVFSGLFLTAGLTAAYLQSYLEGDPDSTDQPSEPGPGHPERAESPSGLCDGPRAKNTSAGGVVAPPST